MRIYERKYIRSSIPVTITLPSRFSLDVFTRAAILRPMPEGFDPHTELARIFTLRDVMVACRERAPSIIRRLDDMLDDNSVEPGLKVHIMDMMLNRAYGKPRQTVYINPDGGETGQSASRVRVYIPDNGRNNLPSGKIVDAEVA